jgi:hypothetical protein
MDEGGGDSVEIVRRGIYARHSLGFFPNQEENVLLFTTSCKSASLQGGCALQRHKSATVF